MFVWSEMKEGLRFSWNGAFCTFFFFWISAWIGHFGGFGRYGRFRPVHADLGPNRPDSARIGPIWSRVGASRRESALKKWKPCGMTRRDAARRAGSDVPRTSPRRTRVRHLWCRVRASQLQTKKNRKFTFSEIEEVPSHKGLGQECKF